MGKKNRNLDEPENYEVWVLYAASGWKRVEEAKNDGIFTSKPRALLIAQSKSNGEGVVEAMVISRRPIATFNGEAIGLKHRVNAVEKKKTEEGNGDVHGSRAEEGDVPAPGPQHVGEAGPGGPVREGAPQG